MDKLWDDLDKQLKTNYAKAMEKNKIDDDFDNFISDIDKQLEIKKANKMLKEEGLDKEIDALSYTKHKKHIMWNHKQQTEKLFKHKKI